MMLARTLPLSRTPEMRILTDDAIPTIFRIPNFPSGASAHMAPKQYARKKIFAGLCVGDEVLFHYRAAQHRGGKVFFGTRKFPRVKLEVEVRVESLGRSLVSRSLEIGAGGMALKDASALDVSQPVQLSFALPDGQDVTVQAVVWWKRATLVGVRFDPSDGNRMHVQHWMDTQKQPA